MRLVLPMLAAATALAACAPPGSPGDRAAKPLSLAGTSWTIAAINGQPVETARPTAVRFTKDRIEGNAGCNSFGGGYTFSDGKLTADRVISTKMACPGPGMEVEGTFFRIIAGATLSSAEGGAIELRGSDAAATLAPAGVSE